MVRKWFVYSKNGSNPQRVIVFSLFLVRKPIQAGVVFFEIKLAELLKSVDEKLLVYVVIVSLCFFSYVNRFKQGVVFLR
jgi:hypothetical protein